MPCRRAYLSNFFYFLDRRGHFDRKDLQGLTQTQQWLVKALFGGAEVAVVVDECCCCGQGTTPQRLGKFFAKVGKGFDLDEAFWEFQDWTGRDLSITQRWLLRAVFAGAEVCLTLSGGPGRNEGDYDWGDSNGSGGGRGEERPPGGGRGEEGGPGGGRGDERGPGGGY